MNGFIEELYRTQLVQDELGNTYTLHSHIDAFEGELLRTLIGADPDIHKTLEIGCAYGLSSLHICSALSNRSSVNHVIVDPFQNERWHGIGVSNLRRAGFHSFRLIEEPSELILPELVRSEAGTYDLIFVDGVHTFDHMMLDFFYATRLIRVGGYVVVDDCNLPSIAKAVSYITKYPCYLSLSRLGQMRLDQDWSRGSFARRIGNTVRYLLPSSIAGYLVPKYLYDSYYSRLMYPSMVILRKMEEDKRNWDWFAAF